MAYLAFFFVQQVLLKFNRYHFFNNWNAPPILCERQTDCQNVHIANVSREMSIHPSALGFWLRIILMTDPV